MFGGRICVGWEFFFHKRLEMLLSPLETYELTV